MKDLTEYLRGVRERLERSLAWRSDDFGHDCQALLEAESMELEYAGETALTLTEICETLMEAIDEYAKPDNWKSSLTVSGGVCEEWIGEEHLFGCDRARQAKVRVETILRGKK